MMTNLLHGAQVANKLFSTIARLRLLLVMFVTLIVSANAWAEEGEATITFSNAGLSNQQSVNGTSFALGDYFTVTYAKNGSSTNPTYYTSGTAIRCYVTKSTSNGNTITINQTAKGKDVNAYITSITYSGKNNQGTTSFAYSGTPTSSSNYSVTYSDANKVTSVVATLKETGGSKNGQFYSTGITIEYTYSGGSSVTPDPCTTPTVAWNTKPANGEVGGSMTASVTTNYSNGLTYSSSNTTVATVTNAGVIKYLAAGTTTITATVTGDGTTICEGPVSVQQEITVTAPTSGGGGGNGECTWELVTDALTLKAGDRVVIAAKDYNYAISTDQKDNNRGQAAITKSTNNSKSVISVPNDDVQILTLENGTTSGTFAFYTGSGYLYAASSGSNYLRTQSTNNANGSWKITISNNTATIVAQGTNSRNTMQYNLSSSIFACYGSASQKALAIYKEVCTGGTTETSVTLNPNGGTFAFTPDGWTKEGNNYKKEGVTGAITLPTPTRTGYDFDGWYYGETKVNQTYTPTETVTLTAQWTAKTTSITLDANTNNNGSGANSSVTATYDQALPEFTACIPATGYTLNGYYTDATNGTRIIDKEGKFVNDVANYTSNEGKWKNESAELTLYAQYTINSYTVTFNNQGHGIKPDDQAITHGEKVTKPVDLTESGFIFGGWYKEAECTSAWDFENDVVTSSITLYAKWTAYTVTWTINPLAGGTLSATSGNSITVTPDAAYTYGSPAYTVTSGSATVSKSGNTFTATPSANCTIQINMVEKPKWTVTFNAGEHGMCATTSLTEISANAGVTLPSVTPASGYRFLGWSTTGSATTADAGTAGETYKPSSNITLYAVYKQLHTITWKVGAVDYATSEVESGTKIATVPANPANTAIGSCANTFMGWSEQNLGSAEGKDAPTDLFTTLNEAQRNYGNIYENKTFYAVFATAEGDGSAEGWTLTSNGLADLTSSDVFVFAVNVSGTYYAMPNDGGTSSSPKLTAITVASNKITSEVGDQLKWNISGDATNGYIFYPDGSTTKWMYCNTTTSSSNNDNIRVGTGTRKAWKQNSSTKYLYNDDNTTRYLSRNGTTDFRSYTNTNNNPIVPKVFKYSAGTTYSNYVTNCCATPVPTNGSYTSPSGTSVTLTWDGESTQYHITGNGLDDYSPEESYTITGLTECDEYTFYVSAYPEGGCESEAIAITVQPFSGAKTVTFNPNGGSVSPTSETTSCTNQSIKLPTPTYSGYRFMGWFNAASGGTKIGEAGASYKPTDDITLYAHWEKEYNVTYNANGGSTTCAGGAYIAGETVTVCTTNPTRTGHTFTGWTYSPNVTITDGKFVMPAGDVTITAQWQVNSYTVTWNPTGGNWGGNTENIVETYEYGATIVQPAAPQRDCYRFTGWSPAVSATMPAGDKTYTAQWKQNYTITFHDGDDVTPWTQTKDAESINLTEYLGTLACDDYQFAGWSTDATKYDDEPANITTWVTGNYTPTANIDLYAVYTKGAVTNDFTLNCAGGVYEIWVNNSAKNHMSGHVNSTPKLYTKEWWNGGCSSCNGTDGTPFTITKIADNTYSIQNADGEYIAKQSSGTHPYVESTWANQDRYKWTISEGTNGSWRFVNKAATDYALVYYNDYFDLCKATSVNGSTSYYDLELTPAASNVYQSNPNCGPYYIIFNTHGGEFIKGEYAYGEEQTGLTETTYSKFPAAELEGYTFAGWRDGNPQEDVNYEPYLKKQGDDLVVSSNKTYHAVYYYYDEEEDIDWSEEFTTGIYAEVNGMKYFLAGTPSSGTMSSTTDCGYVSEVTITPGTGANAGKYKITVNGVDMAPEVGETDLVAGTAWWTITETSVGSGEYKISGEDKRNIVLRNSSFGHYSYNAGSSYDAGYYYPRFGKCLEHHWTSDPAPKPSIKLSGDIYITATNSRAIRATETIKVVANNLSAGESITLTSTSSDVYFSTDRTFNFAAGQAANQKPKTSLTLPTDAEGNLATTDVYIHYMPSSEGDGVPENVVVSANLETPNPSITDDHTIHVRNLPSKFVIATKVGATWYALPADMTDDTNPLAEVIEVDEATMTATASNTTTYTLWPVKTTNGTGNRYADYGDRLRFAAVNYEQRGLWANNNNNSSAIRNYAVINSLGADGLTAYEWKVTTTVVDGHWQYTLQTDQTQNQNYLRYWTSAEGTPVGPKWGTYNAGENKLYFLPVTETQPFEYAVVEWYPTKVLIQTDAAITSPTVKVDGEAVASPILTHKGDKLYEISNLPLETNPNKLLQISFTDNAINYINTKVVPIILSRGAKTITGEPFATLTQKVYQYADVVVRDGATLSVDGTTDVANTLLGVTIYPTAKVSVAEGKKLSVHSLTFFGGIDEIYDGSTYKINKYGVPQLSLKGILNKTVTTMDYIMRVDLDQMYQVGVPYDVDLNDITYWDGSAIKLGDELYVSAYDGQARANRDKKTWVYETDFETRFGSATLKAGVGYTISAEPQNSDDTYSILRMPMTKNISSGDTEWEKKVNVVAYDNQKGVTITDNHKGWNYLSNPYMTTISGGEADTKLVLGYLKETGTGPWEWVNDEIRYVTIPMDNGKDYYQNKFSEAKLKPFKSFFVQIAQGGELSFALASRQNAPARLLQQDTTPSEIEFELLLSNATQSDNTGLLISEEYTPAYEINADLEKMMSAMSVYTIYNGYNLAYNALSPLNTKEQIPVGYIVPVEGEYTLELDPNSDLDAIKHIYLMDYDMGVTTDLINDAYTFYAADTKSDKRFAINIELSSDIENKPTGFEDVGLEGQRSYKFIYDGVLYIMNNGVIYSTTGQQLNTMDK